jgi:hypothetical protein
MALESITVTTGATINGRALARNGAVTLDTNVIGSSTCPPAAAPLPSVAPSIPNAAFSPENEAVTPWPLAALIGGVAVVLLSGVVAFRGRTVRKGI